MDWLPVVIAARRQEALDLRRIVEKRPTAAFGQRVEFLRLGCDKVLLDRYITAN
jgi:hypothetical protein